MTLKAAVTVCLVAALPLAGYADGQGWTVHKLGLFTLAVPDAWQTKPPSGDTAIQTVGPVDSDGLADTVEVVVRRLPSNVSDAKGCESMVKWVMRVFMHISYTTLSEGPTTIGTLPAYGHTYNWKAKNGSTRWSTQACVVDHDHAFILTGTTADEPHASPARAGLLASILNSFRLAGGGAAH